MWIAAAQSTVSHNPRQNGMEIRSLMQRAHDAGARLVHFPEGAMSGYPTFENQDWDVLREELELTAALAGKLKLWTVIGSNHRLTSPNRPHNSLYVISDSGDIVTRYDKRLCSFNEINNHYSPGRDPVVFIVDGFRFGCALCIEINFPELFLEYEKLNIDCLLFSSNGKAQIFGILAQGHAAANNYWFSVSIAAQYADALPSGIIGPDGCWIAQCTSDAIPDLSLAQLDRSSVQFDIALNKARPWRRLARDGETFATKFARDDRSENKTEF
jgi:predicted amidohydrolase